MCSMKGSNLCIKVFRVKFWWEISYFTVYSLPFTADCAEPNWFDDNFCDDENNVPECGYDGEDCCDPNSNLVMYCTVCACLNCNDPYYTGWLKQNLMKIIYPKNSFDHLSRYGSKIVLSWIFVVNMSGI